jgi:hypothetical protein
MFKTSSYANADQDMSLMFDHFGKIGFQATHFAGGHYSTATGDFALGGDARFTLDGAYYGLCPTQAGNVSILSWKCVCFELEMWLFRAGNVAISSWKCVANGAHLLKSSKTTPKARIRADSARETVKLHVLGQKSSVQGNVPRNIHVSSRLLVHTYLHACIHAGDWIIFKPPRPITLTRMQFYARTDAAGPLRAPGKFKLYQSHDGVTWTEFFDYTSAKLVYPGKSFTAGVSVQAGGGHAYIGLVVGSLAGESAESEVLQIMEWAIYGRPYACTQVGIGSLLRMFL